jgi:hypothetical protein
MINDVCPGAWMVLVKMRRHNTLVMGYFDLQSHVKNLFLKPGKHNVLAIFLKQLMTSLTDQLYF